MNIYELLEKVDPESEFYAAMDNVATEHSYYLYKLQLMSLDYWEPYVWYFDTTDQFATFIPALLFNNILGNDIEDFEDVDFSESYAEYLEAKQGDWDESRMFEFIKNFYSDRLELLEVGKVSDLLKFSPEDFELCRNEFFYDPEKFNDISEVKYRIINKFSEVSELCPAQNEEDFLKFLNVGVNEG